MYPRTRRSLLTAAAMTAALATTAPLNAQTQQDRPRMSERSVTVSATGTTQAAPDMAAITSGVQTEASTAREAMSQNSTAMTRLVDGLKKLGIEARDIQTTSINIHPRYTNPRDGKPPSISGYVASNSVRVVVRDLKKIGEMLDQMITLGANQMSGISFEVSKAETLKDDARKAAMENARRRAELYASAAGASLGEVLTISENIAMAGPRPVQLQSRAAMADSVPVEAGEMRLDATIHVTWALK